MPYDDETPYQREIRERADIARAVGCWEREFPLRHTTKAREMWVPEYPLDADFSRAIDAVVEPLNGGGTVVICGPRGRGKTLLATYMALSCAHAGHQSRYFRAADMFGAFRGLCFGSDTAWTENGLIKSWAEPRLFVIDEVQDAGGTDFSTTLLTRVLDHRYGAMKPTILISNLLVDAFLEHVGKSIASRLDETGTFVVMDGVNHRTQGKK